MKNDCADVVIIGAGPAGAVAAKRFADSGYSVVCIERGDWPDYSSAHASDEFLDLCANKQWAWSPNRRHSSSDYLIDTSKSDVEPLMWNGVGGSSVLYCALWMRLKPSDFRVRSLDGVGDDWPLSYSELSPFYSRIDAEFGVSGHPGDPAYPDISSYPLPPAPMGQAARMLAKAHDSLGWHWWPGSNAIATLPYRTLRADRQRATELWGNFDRSKATPDVTHWPELVARGVTLITNATVREIEVDAAGRATGVVYIDATGREVRQLASFVAVAANGIGTPRLLLSSTSRRFPEGLGNSSGLVGHRLMMHPFATVTGIFDEDVKPWRTIWGQTIYSLQFYETDPSRGFVRGAKWNILPTGGPQTLGGKFPWGDDPIWGDKFHDTIQRRLGHSFGWGIIAEDLPEFDNCVSVDTAIVEPDGLPAVRVAYKTSKNTVDLLKFNVERATESLMAAGARDTVTAPVLRESGWHILGTAVMGNDRESSVVDRWGVMHDVPNVMIVDGSIWPTSSGMNPTATITALALRNTEHAIATRGAGM